jgi:hypothetical protein
LTAASVTTIAMLTDDSDRPICSAFVNRRSHPRETDTATPIATNTNAATFQFPALADPSRKSAKPKPANLHVRRS